MIFQYINSTGGLSTELSPLLQPPDTTAQLSGCNTSYKLGALLKDTGYTIVGAALQANKSITGLFNFRQSSSTQKMLATVDDSTSDDTQLFYSTGGAWTEIAGAETYWANKAGITVEMEEFIGYCFFVGYGSTDGFLPPISLTGTTVSNSTNVTSMPNAKYIKRYRDRLYIANCDISGTTYPYRVYFSSVPSSGAITWTQASDFFDVDYSEEITGIAQNWDRLLIFTEYSTYMYDQASLKKIWDIGGYHKTIQTHGPYVYFANSNGVWRSSGGQPENISDNIKQFFEGGNPASWYSALVNEEYNLYVGDVTVSQVAYTNTLTSLHIPTLQWRSRELTDNLTAMARRLTGGQQYLWFGDTAGKIYVKGRYWDSTLLSSDNGSAFPANFELAPFYIGNLKFNSDVQRLTAFAEKAQGLKLKYRLLDRSQRVLTPYKPLGELKAYINHFDIDMTEGVLIQIAGSEHGSSEYFSFYGCELEGEPVSEVIKPA